MGRGESESSESPEWLARSGEREIIPESSLAGLHLRGLQGGRLDFEDGETLLLSWVGVSARVEGELRELVGMSPREEEGGVESGSAQVAEIEVRSGTLISADGVIDLAPGIYLLNGEAFQRVANLAGVDDRALAVQIATGKRASRALPEWSSLSFETQTALAAITKSAGDDGEGSELEEMSFVQASWGAGGEEVWAARETLKTGLREAYESGLAVAESAEATSGWRLSAAGEELYKSSQL